MSALIESLLPYTYVSAGALVHMETVSSGQASPAADEDYPRAGKTPAPESSSSFSPRPCWASGRLRLLRAARPMVAALLAGVAAFLVDVYLH
jgi:hypothetical protein